MLPPKMLRVCESPTLPGRGMAWSLRGPRRVNVEYWREAIETGGRARARGLAFRRAFLESAENSVVVVGVNRRTSGDGRNLMAEAGTVSRQSGSACLGAVRTSLAALCSGMLFGTAPCVSLLGKAGGVRWLMVRNGAWSTADMEGHSSLVTDAIFCVAGVSLLRIEGLLLWRAHT